MSSNIRHQHRCSRFKKFFWIRTDKIQTNICKTSGPDKLQIFICILFVWIWIWFLGSNTDRWQNESASNLDQCISRVSSWAHFRPLINGSWVKHPSHIITEISTRVISILKCLTNMRIFDIADTDMKIIEILDTDADMDRIFFENQVLLLGSKIWKFETMAVRCFLECPNYIIFSIKSFGIFNFPVICPIL